jgi:hypothetical protein
MAGTMVSGMVTLDPAASWQSLYELLMAQLASIEADAAGLDAATIAAIREVAEWSKSQMIAPPAPQECREPRHC